MQLRIEQRQALRKRVADERGKALAQIAPNDTTRVARAHDQAAMRFRRTNVAMRPGGDRAAASLGRGRNRTTRLPTFSLPARRCSTRKKIPHRLRGRGIGHPAVAASKFERRMLDLALQADTFHDVVPRQVVGPHVGEQRAVGILAIAREAAHTVNDDTALLACRRDDFPTWAHAESVYTTGRALACSIPATIARASGDAHRHLVVGGTERRVLRSSAVLRTVDERLGMFDAHAHREGLALEGEPPIAGELKDVARRVPARDNDARGLNRFASARAGILQRDRADRTARQLDISQAGKETHLATCGDNTLANTLHDGGQLVGTDMGLRLPENLVRRPRLDKRLEHVADMRAFRARSQLAVGKRASAAFPELHVRRCIERAALVEGLDGHRALINCGPALDHERTQPRFRQEQCAEQPRRARSCDHDALIRRCRERAQIGNRKRRRRVVRANIYPASGGKRVVGHALRKVDGIGGVEMHVRLLPRIDATLHKGKRGDVLGRDSKRGGDGGA